MTSSDIPQNLQNIRLVVRSREGILFDKEVLSVSSKNNKGDFDVLPGHANFISIIDAPLVVKEAGGQEKTIPVGESGIMRVNRNIVEVLLGVKA